MTTASDSVVSPRRRIALLKAGHLVSDTGILAQQGVNIVEQLVLGEGAIFRPQVLHDHGIDGHIEIKVDGRASGRLVGVQVKAGRSYFKNRGRGGWSHPVKKRHRDYWALYSLPVVVVLVDVETRVAYVQEATSSLMVPSGNSYKLYVPADQSLSSFWPELVTLALTEPSATVFAQQVAALPPRVADNIIDLANEDLRTANRLGSLLVGAGASPEVVLDGICSDPPYWMGGGAWGVVACFAEQHGLRKQAADLYSSLATRSSGAPRDVAALAAATLLKEESPTEAQALLRLMSPTALAEAWPHLLQRIVSREGAAEVLVGENELSSESALQDFHIQELLAKQAVGLDHEDAVAASQRLLDLDERNSGAMLLLAQSLLLRSRGQDRRSTDLVLAETTLEAAVDQRRRWRGNTKGFLELLGQVKGMLGHHAAILEWCAAAPLGKAAREEAGRPEVARMSLAAAVSMGRRDLCDSILKSVEDIEARQRLEVMFDIATPLSDGPVAYWTRQLDEAVDADDFPLALQALQSLAWEGVDDSDKMKALSDHESQRAVLDLVRGQALAMSGSVGGLTSLRRLSATSLDAVHVLLVALLRQERFRDAIDAARSGADRFSTPEFATYEVDALRKLGQRAEMERAALHALAAPELADDGRQHMLRTLGELANDERRWEASERFFADLCALGISPRPSDVWSWAAAQVNVGRPRGAWKRIHDFDLQPTSEFQARIWITAASASPWALNDWTTSIQLAETYAESDLGPVLTLHALDRHSVFADSLVEVEVEGVSSGPKWLERLQRLVALFASEDEHAVLRIVTGDIDALVELLKKTLAGRAETVRSLLLAMRGSMPAGSLASLTRKPYSLVCIERPLGYIRVASSDDEVHALEVDAAARALDSDLLADASAVLFAEAAGKREELASEFTSVRVTPGTSRDLLEGSAEYDRMARSSGSMGWDAAEIRPTMSEMDEAQAKEYSRKAATLRTLHDHAAVERRPLPADIFGDDDDDWDGHERRSLAHDSWIESVTYAHGHDLPLWSDDEAHRAFARSAGVQTFGSNALLEAVAIRDVLSDPAALPKRAIELQAAQMHLVAIGAVGTPVPDQDLEILARQTGWTTELSYIVARPDWWLRAADAVQSIRWIFTQVLQEDTEALATWEASACEGAALVKFGSSSGGAESIAIVMLLSWSLDSRESRGMELVRLGRRAARAFELPDPLAKLGGAARVLNELERGTVSADCVDLLAQLGSKEGYAG